jgi:hypothetical protein
MTNNMDKEQPVIDTTTDDASSHSRRRFLILIAGAVLVSLLLTAVSMALYNNSGAAQLDLSRPGYKSVRSQVEGSSDSQDYPDSGTINQKAIDDFKALLQKQTKKIEAVDAFSGDPLSPTSLGLSTEATATPQP